MPMPNDIQDYLINADESVKSLENSPKDLIVGQDSNVRHLCGKNEKYSLYEDQKRIVKDIVTIYADGIECLHAVCSTINSHNTPLARHEVLIPTNTLGFLSENIQIESQAFYKLKYKYPQLLKSLQARQLHTSNRISR